MKNRVFIRLITLPCRVRGFTMIDEDDNYNIYINEKLGYDMQKQVYKHELRHILRGDIHSGLPIRYLESDN